MGTLARPALTFYGGLFTVALKPDAQAKNLLRHPFACASGFNSTLCHPKLPRRE